MKSISLIILITCFYLSVQAQERNISGKITAFNTYPLKQVTVSAKKAKTTILTDSLGNFQISCKNSDQLKIAASGFRQQVIKLSDENILNINMIFNDNTSSFKSAVANKHISEIDLSFAVENLMQENNDYSRYQSVFDLIQSKYPLAKVIENNGFNRIYLTSQGPNSIEAGSQALIIVDGIATENISSIQPVQVAQFRVITGVDASLYGTRGGNGVVEIELKH